MKTNNAAVSKMLDAFAAMTLPKQQVLAIFDTWLDVAESDGVARREPLYARQLQRAMDVLNASSTVAEAATQMRAEEIAAGLRAPSA
jgi:hypothetical protein